LEYNSNIHNKIRVNGILYDYNQYGDWDYFVVKKQKMRGEIHIILIHLKSMQTIFCEAEKFKDSSSDELSSSSIDWVKIISQKV